MENKENITTTTGNGVNSIIDVRGIQIDISSVLKDVTNSIKNNLKTSFDDVLKDYELYKSTHDALLQIPFIKDLYNKNSELSLQVKTLKQQEEEGLKYCEEEDGEEHEPTITLNIHDSFIKNNDDEPFSLRADFFKINKMNKKQPENDFEIENSEEEEEAEEEAISEADEEADEEEEEEEEEEESEKEESEEESEAEEEESEAEEAEEEAEEEESEAEEEEEEEESEAEEAEEEEEEAEEEEAEEEVKEEEEEVKEEEEEVKEEEEAKEEEEEEAISEAKEEEEEEEEEEAEEEEEEVFEILIKNVTYYTTNKQDGDIYSCVNNDVGEIVGKFKNGKPSFSKRK